jgi:transposase
MNYVKVQCGYYCGVDLHSVSMMVCVLRDDGKLLFRKRIRNQTSLFFEIISPYKHSLAVAVESTFNWYWFVDGCRAAGINIFLGHSFYMQSIAKDKNKNDKLDSYKIAQLLRAGFFPRAHACSAEKRPIRDLLRHRSRLQHMRSEFLTITKDTFYQNGIIDLKQNALNNKGTRYSSLESLENKHTHLSSVSNMNMVTALDKELSTIESELILHTNAHYKEESSLLQAIIGIGPIISMTIMYETDNINRFKHRQDYSSYCRFAKPLHFSDGKVVGVGNAKCGNPYLKWAFMEIVTHAIRHCKEIAAVHADLKSKHKPLRARGILASRYCTAVYYMLKRNEPFDLKRFCNVSTEVMQPDLRLEYQNHMG